MKLDLDMADVKPSIPSFLVVGLMAVVFIVLFKVLMERYPIPGFVDLARIV